jgi:hypothetical protein
MWTNYQNDLILEDHPVSGAAWPEEAQEVIRDAGIEASAGPVEYREHASGSAVNH